MNKQTLALDNMDDATWINTIGTVNDPQLACQLLAENETFLGFDPYYSELRRALIEMCERCGKPQQKGKNDENTI